MLKQSFSFGHPGIAMIRSTVTPYVRSRRRSAALLSLLTMLFVTDVHAADILVTTTADSGAGSLRQALTAAQSGDRVVFNIPGTPTIQLLSDLPTVTTNISFAN
jgi:hypothetical protein